MRTASAPNNGGGGRGGGSENASDGRSLADTSQLAELLAADRPLEATRRAFSETYGPRERFRANCTLCTMLEVRATLDRPPA